jgi:hypothetical protein
MCDTYSLLKVVMQMHYKTSTLMAMKFKYPVDKPMDGITEVYKGRIHEYQTVPKLGKVNSFKQGTRGKSASKDSEMNSECNSSEASCMAAFLHCCLQAADMKQLLDLSVDGIVTNKPAALKEGIEWGVERCGGTASNRHVHDYEHAEFL